MATTGLGGNCHLLFFNDCTLGQCYLVYSGAEDSVLPATMSDRQERKKGSHLQLANGTHIPSTEPRPFTLTLECTTNFLGPSLTQMSVGLTYVEISFAILTY